LAPAVNGRRRSGLLANLALAAAALTATALAAELFLRAIDYVPHRLRASARLVDAHWRLLGDSHPANPRGYFDIDLRTPESREAYLHLGPHRYDRVASAVPTPWSSATTRSGFATWSPRPSRRACGGSSWSGTPSPRARG